MGSLAAGGATLMGAGAFTSVTADRTVDVNVAGDASAYLGLKPVSSSPNSDFVEVNSEEVSLDFSSSNNSNDLGNGFNPDATTRINDLLQVSNQGTQPVNFWVNIKNLGAGSDFVTIEASGYPTFNSNFGKTTGASSQLAFDGGNAGNLKPYTLDTGEDIYLHLVVDAGGELPNNFNGSVTFVAENDGMPGN